MAALVIGCGAGDQGESPDAGGIDPDALVGCIDQRGAEVGRCVREDQSPCTGPSDASQSFVALIGDTTEVGAVVGFQGATMFSMALRATGIHPGLETGSPDDYPVVDVALHDGADSVISNYFRRIYFEPVSAAPGTYELLSVYLLVDGVVQDLAGHTLTARATVTDRDGVVVCGEGSFVAALP